MSSTVTPYDEVRYPGKFYPQASPERLATLATLYGLLPAPVENCRVLEMGCGEGGNILPLAYVFPNSEFVGVDLSSTAIEYGNGLLQRLGLDNARLLAQDLMDFPSSAGEFDYIIAHGVLSWVPEAVRQQMLEICARHLAPRGVAYISYNTMPGGYLRNFARDLMRFHTKFISDPAQKTREARNIIDFVIAAIPAPTIERELLKREMKPYEGKDFFLYHDLLADVNDPVYFLDFMDAAARCGLQYISEANLSFMRTAHFPESIRKQLDDMPDRLMREQYLDFINGRRFRQTILCRAGHDLNLEVIPERMERLLISSWAKPVSPITDVHHAGKVEFQRGNSPKAVCGDSLSKAMFLALGKAYPRGLRYSELREEVCRLAGREPSELSPEDDAKLIQMIVSSFANDVLELHTYQFQYTTSVSARPVANAVARLQAELGHSVVSMSLISFGLQQGLFRALIPLLDGTRNMESLMIELSAQPGGSELESVTSENVRRILETLASNGILIA
jgi:SAM-dependent methyltransferase/methyltransferase-like protein